MKALLLITLLIGACDFRPPKGSDQDWQLRQEQMEKDKNEDIQHLDEEMQREEERREVFYGEQVDDVNFTPANN